MLRELSMRWRKLGRIKRRSPIEEKVEWFRSTLDPPRTPKRRRRQVRDAAVLRRKLHHRFSFIRMQREAWEDLRPLHLYCLQAVWIESQRSQDGWGYLERFDRTCHCFRVEPWVGEQHDHVDVVMSESPMLGMFCGALRVGNFHVRRHQDVRRARIAAVAARVRCRVA